MRDGQGLEFHMKDEPSRSAPRARELPGIQLIETISAEGDGYVLALRFVQKGVVNLTHHTMTQPQIIGIRQSRRGNWGIGTQRLEHGKPVISVPPSQRAVRRRA